MSAAERPAPVAAASRLSGGGQRPVVAAESALTVRARPQSPRPFRPRQRKQTRVGRRGRRAGDRRGVSRGRGAGDRGASIAAAVPSRAPRPVRPARADHRTDRADVAAILAMIGSTIA